MSNKVNHPVNIHVSGLPFPWRGWNGNYILAGEKDGFPIWKLPSHSYFGIEIRPTKIYRKDNECWVLRIDDGWNMIIATGPNSDLPFGDWCHCLVTPQESLTTFWRSNDVLCKMPKCLNDPKRNYTGTEPSPKGLGWCAHAEKIGTIKKGKDHNEWIVKNVNGGTKRWVRYVSDDLGKLTRLLDRIFYRWWMKLAKGGLMAIYRNNTYKIFHSTKTTHKAQVNEMKKLHNDLALNSDVKAIIWSAQSRDTLDQFIDYLLEKVNNKILEELVDCSYPLDVLVTHYKTLFFKSKLESVKDYTFNGIDGNDRKILNKISKSKLLSKYL